MGSYRYIPLKGSVPVGPPVELESDDDDEAIELVRLSLARTDCELWRGSRRIAVIPKDRAPVIHVEE
jgi:hypothetical protein